MPDEGQSQQLATATATDGDTSGTLAVTPEQLEALVQQRIREQRLLDQAAVDKIVGRTRIEEREKATRRGQTQPQAQSATATTSDDIDRAAYRQLDRALGKLDLNATQERLLERQFAEERPQDVVGWVAKTCTDLGWARSAPALTTTTEAAAAAAANGSHVTHIPGQVEAIAKALAQLNAAPMTSASVYDRTPPLDWSHDDIERLKVEKGKAAYAFFKERVLQQLAGIRVLPPARPARR